jgi:ubiquinone/menaquinone biosynthesis C-methylase UbiE
VLIGVDLIERHLEVARARSRAVGWTHRFRAADAFALPFADASFDLVVCRHMLQAVPRPENAMAEMVRVLRPGGRLHLLVEDYGMIHMHPTRSRRGPFLGRRPPDFGPPPERTSHRAHRLSHVRRFRSMDVAQHYVVVDTLRVPRETFASIWEAWRDGYADPIGEHTRFHPR